MSVDGLRESRRGELGKELVGSHPSQDRLYHWFKSNDYGRILSDNNAYIIKHKRMVCLSYRSEFEVLRNFCVAQGVDKCGQPKVPSLKDRCESVEDVEFLLSCESDKIQEDDVSDSESRTTKLVTRSHTYR